MLGLDKERQVPVRRSTYGTSRRKRLIDAGDQALSLPVRPGGDAGDAMDWLRELPWQVFWFGWGMVALLAGGSLYAVGWAKRNAMAIGAQTPVNVSDLSAGYRMAWGTTVGPDLKAPLTGRPCAWWKVQVWESVRESRPGKAGIGPDATRWIWREAVSEESDRPLLFGDGKAVAAVWTWGTTAVIPSGWSDWRGQSLPPEDRNPELRQGGAPG